MKRVLLLFCILPLIGFGTGCGPTYPKDTLASSVMELCKKEYGIDVSVQMTGKTLGVRVPLDKLFDSTLQLSPDVGSQLDGVILSTSRVVLSTDDPPDFYVVVAQDKRIPGVELKLTRYVKDIRRLHYNDISRGEYTKRMLFEFGLDLGIFQEGDQFRIEEVHFESFLAQQMAHRIKLYVDEEKSLQETFQLKSSRGEFITPRPYSYGEREERFGHFLITLDLQKRGMDLWGEAVPEDHQKAILEAVLQVTSEVLRGYRFESFDYLEIKTPFLQHTFILDHNILDLYRKKKLPLSELLLPNHFNLSPHDTELLLKK